MAITYIGVMPVTLWSLSLRTDGIFRFTNQENLILVQSHRLSGWFRGFLSMN